MSAIPPGSRRIWRRVALAAAAVFVVLVAGLVIYVHRLLQPQRFTSLLERDLAAAGLKLELQAPAEPTLFPRPGVRLEGFDLTNVGSRIPVLQADGATIVVPWRALLKGDAAIERVDVDAPRVDLGELETLLARLPRHTGPPRLPAIAIGIHMRDGTLIRNGSPLLLDFSLATGALAPGQTFQLDASARSAGGRRLSALLTTIPTSAHDGAIDFNSVEIALAGQPGTTVQLAGRGRWRGGADLALQLQGTLQRQLRATPPAASTNAGPAAIAATGSAPVPATSVAITRVALEVLPAHAAKPLSIALKLDGNGTHADLQLRPTEFRHWWTRTLAGDLSTPVAALPLTGTGHAEQIDFGWFKATDVSIDVGPDVAPSAGTAGGPAPTSSAR